MQSIRRKRLVYSDTGTSVLEHDDDYDSELIYIGNDKVYKGAIDPNYTEFGLDVQWLYNDVSERVGLIEYETLDREVYEVLWYYSNPFATFLQERGWKTSGSTVFSKMTNEAYVDSLNSEFKNILLGSDERVILPYMLESIPSYFYECSDCGKRTFSVTNNCRSLKKIYFSVNAPILFLDDSYVIYTAPADSKIWKVIPRPQQVGGGEQPAEPVSAPEQAQQHPRLEHLRSEQYPLRSELSPSPEQSE